MLFRSIRRMNFIIADCAEEPYSYTLDWVATFQSLEELEAYKNAKDDGENDADDVEEVVMSNVLNQTTGKDYSELSEALTDAADHDVLVRNTDITVTSRINIEKPLTLIAGTEGATISRGEGYLGGLVILTRTGGDLTLGGSGGSLILDGCNLLSTSNFIEASNGATTTLHSQVVMRNCVSTSVLGPAICNKSNGKLVLDGATFENCRTVNVNGETIADKGVVFVGTGITLSGNNTFVNCCGADIFIE